MIRRIKPGDGIASLSAQTWSVFCEMAEQWMLSRGVQIVRNQFAERDSGIVLVNNATGGDVAQGAVLEITGTPFVPNTNYTEPVSSAPYYERRANLRAFMRGVVLTGDTPSSVNVTKFAIAIAPARDGTVVRAITSGAVHVRVKMNSEDHEFARVVNGETAYLESAASGPVKLLYVQPDSERDPGDADKLAWCIGLLGGGGGGPLYVTLKQAGGSTGSVTTACTLAYDLWPENEMDQDTPFSDTDRRLATGLQPQKFQRTPIGTHTAASNGSLGLAYMQSDGSYTLLIAFDEQPFAEPECE